MRATVMLLSAAFLLGAASPLHAESLARLFSAGNEAYFRGDYAQAIDTYGELLEAGVRDADVFYNLATAHAREGECGRAIQRFEQSLLLDPTSAAAERGIAACRRQLGHARAEKSGEALVQARPPLHEALVRPWSENHLAWSVLAFSVLTFGLLIALGWARRETLRLGLGIGAALSGVFLVLCATGLAIKTGAFREGTPAVVLRDDSSLREGPDPRALTRATGEEGQPARILQREGDFVRIALSGGQEGWMKRDQVGAIDLD